VLSKNIALRVEKDEIKENISNPLKRYELYKKYSCMCDMYDLK
jgi:SpoVK/Ycf46/Vps4 family AAA+-type ATPase